MTDTSPLEMALPTSSFQPTPALPEMRVANEVVRIDDHQVGSPIATVCSGSPSPTLKKNIGLVYLPRELGKKGSDFGVVIRGAVKRATVVKTPFYKRNQL